jgi:hypothetical protein
LTKKTLRENPFIPLDGELIIYDPDSIFTERRIKIGDGATNVVALSFVYDKEEIKAYIRSYIEEVILGGEW